MAFPPLVYLLVSAVVFTATTSPSLPLVTIKNKFHGYYLSVGPGNGARARAANAPKAWEKWRVILHDDGSYSFQNDAHGTYLGVETQWCNVFGFCWGREAYGAKVQKGWEKFRLVRHSDGSVSFRTAHNDFLSLPNYPNGQAHGTDKLDAWEIFELVSLGPKLSGDFIDGFLYLDEAEARKHISEQFEFKPGKGGAMYFALTPDDAYRKVHKFSGGGLLYCRVRTGKVKVVEHMNPHTTKVSLKAEGYDSIYIQGTIHKARGYDVARPEYAVFDRNRIELPCRLETDFDLSE